MRHNQIGIQMIPHSIHAQLFPNKTMVDPRILELAKTHLTRHDLLGKTLEPLPEPSIKLPKLVSKHPDIASHFYNLGVEAQHVYYDQASRLAQVKQYPLRPKVWQRIEGWVKYYPNGSFERIGCLPRGASVVFDVETLYQLSPYPVIAVAASESNWFSWSMPGLFDGSCKIPNTLIPIGYPNHERVIVGHNVTYDRARILEEYSLKPSKFAFIDTMSLHCAVAGLSSQQRGEWLKFQKTPRENPSWEEKSSMNSLLHVVKLHLNETMDKDMRSQLGELTVDLFSQPQTFQDMMTYCSEDVLVTFKLLKVLLPKFREKCPHPVSFAGMLEIAKAFLPTSKYTWESYIKNADAEFDKFQNEIQKRLNQAALDALDLLPCQRLGDPWLMELDWNVNRTRYTKAGSLAKNQNLELLGKPNWYRQLWHVQSKSIHLSITQQIAPYLLKMCWKGSPLVYRSGAGWCYYEKTTQPTENPSSIIYSYLNQVPLPSSPATSSKTGSPFSKFFRGALEMGDMHSNSATALDIFQLKRKCSFWLAYRKRIVSQFVVGNDSHRISSEMPQDFAVILPQQIPMGTVTRRCVEPLWMTASNPKKDQIGSEIKAKVIAPQGYKFVGADVDSQELWIASLLGDRIFRTHGATAIGFMTLQGTKSKGTDLHSMSGKIMGISRDDAKQFNYSRIYGAGINFAKGILATMNPGLDKDQVSAKVNDLYKSTKGERVRKDGKLFGGSETFMFNELESIANSKICETPVLKCKIPDSLDSSNVQGQVFLSDLVFA
jgi:DNA polymerase gamma 1